METIELPSTRAVATELNGADHHLDLTLPDRAGNVRGSWRFSLDAVRAGIAHYPLEAKEKLLTAFQWCIDSAHLVSLESFASRVQSSANTIYKIYTGKYLYPNSKKQILPSAELLAAIDNFLNIERIRFEGAHAKIVMTPTLKQIVTLCDLARESQTICVVKGPSHIGKTKAAEHYKNDTKKGVTFYTRMQSGCGYNDMVRNLASSVGQSPNGGNVRGIMDAILGGVTGDMLWLFDEMSLLAHTYRKGNFFRCIEALREVHDRNKVPMVWFFTQLDPFQAARNGELQQAWRRGVHKLILPDMPTVGDLTAILENRGLEFPDKGLEVEIRYEDAKGKPQTIVQNPRNILFEVARDEALLAINERLRYAEKLAKQDGDKLNWSHFITAHLIIAKQAMPAEREQAWNN
jgi:DNA transposition AAA+ family ATPase